MHFMGAKKTKKTKKVPFPHPFMTNTHEVPREAFEVLLARLIGREGMTWQEGKLTREALINSMWLWAEEVGADRVAQGITPHLRRLEAVLGEAKSEPGQFGQGPPAKKPAVRKRRPGG